MKQLSAFSSSVQDAVRRTISSTVTIGVAALALGVGIGIGQGLMGKAPAAMAQSATQVVRSGTEQDVIRVVRQVSPAVVTIRTNEGLGTGVVIDGKNGTILTNAHVVGSSRTVGVGLKGRKPIIGTVLGRDRTVDIAVVRVGTKGLTQATLGNSDKLDVGQTAIAIGNPLGLEQSVTTGVVSAVNRRLRITDADGAGFIQTDAAINPGNSGGPLLDSSGRVIGINTAVLRPEGAEGLGLAVPINAARDVARQLIQSGQVRRPGLGILIGGAINPGIASAYGIPVKQGVVIGGVTPAAQREGLQPDDIMTRINNKPLRTVGDLLQILRSSKIGSTVTITVVREVRPRDFRTLTVRARIIALTSG